VTNLQDVFLQVTVLPSVTSIEEPFNDLMVLLPLWLPAVLVGLAIQWFVVRSAVLAALRIHARRSLTDD
jgi:hypothetical protein